MKLLYIYDKMPSTYQEYLIVLLQELKKRIPLNVLVYDDDDDDRADYNMKSYSLKKKIHQLVSKLKLTQRPTLDVRIMSNYDIIHLQHSYLFPKLSSFFKDSLIKPKIVITLRGADTYIKPWIYEKWEVFYKTQSQYIAAFITVSNHQKEYLQKWGVSEDKIYVIPVSFGNKTNAQPKYPSIDRIKIVSAHRMCWEKNIEGNLRVIKLLKEKGYSVQYDIFGDGPDKGQVFYLIDKYNLEEEVTYYGKIENELFKSKLIDYDFFLQLSHSEAFGASVIEAQSKGVPCIVSNSGGLPEAININKSGFCVKPYNIDEAVNYIVDLYLNPDKYFSFSKEAIRNSNENFTVEIEVKKLMNLYNSLISN